MENNITDSNGYTIHKWTTMAFGAGWYNLTCIIQHNSTLRYNASISQIEMWVKLERPLIIDQIVVDNPSIFRNDSFTPYKSNVTVHTKDANVGDADNSNVTFYNSTDFLGNCTTNFHWVVYTD
jgi:hypothetical protein